MILCVLATAIDAVGSLVAAAAAGRSFLGHSASGGRPERVAGQQRRLAMGLLLALTLKSGAGLIRLSLIQTWHQLGIVAAIIALRFALGKVLARVGPPASGRDRAR